MLMEVFLLHVLTHISRRTLTVRAGRDYFGMNQNNIPASKPVGRQTRVNNVACGAPRIQRRETIDYVPVKYAKEVCWLGLVLPLSNSVAAPFRQFQTGDNLPREYWSMDFEKLPIAKHGHKTVLLRDGVLEMLMTVG